MPAGRYDFSDVKGTWLIGGQRRANGSIVGQIGTGLQAEGQLEAVCGVRAIREAPIYGRNRDKLAERYASAIVALDPANGSQIERLRGLMRDWQKRVGDKLAIPDGNKVPPRLDLSLEPREPDQWQPEWIRRKYFPPPK